MTPWDPYWHDRWWLIGIGKVSEVSTSHKKRNQTLRIPVARNQTNTRWSRLDPTNAYPKTALYGITLQPPPFIADCLYHTQFDALRASIYHLGHLDMADIKEDGFKVSNSSLLMRE